MLYLIIPEFRNDDIVKHDCEAKLWRLNEMMKLQENYRVSGKLLRY